MHYHDVELSGDIEFSKVVEQITETPQTIIK